MPTHTPEYPAPTPEQMEALAKLANQNPPGWAALEAWMAHHKGECLAYLGQCNEPIEIYRAQGGLKIMKLLRDDIQSQLDSLRRKK